MPVGETGTESVSGSESGAAEHDTHEEAEGSIEGVPHRESTGWLTTPWYRSGWGIGIVVFDVLLTLALVAATARQWTSAFADLSSVPLGVVPWYIYVFSVLGALGFVFTTLIEDFHSEAADVLKYNFRLPAALPLGAGIFLLSDVALGEATQAGPVIVGTVFLSGLYVNLAYKRLGALARRLLPASKQAESAAEGGGEDDTPEESKS